MARYNGPAKRGRARAMALAPHTCVTVFFLPASRRRQGRGRPEIAATYWQVRAFRSSSACPVCQPHVCAPRLCLVAFFGGWCACRARREREESVRRSRQVRHASAGRAKRPTLGVALVPARWAAVRARWPPSGAPRGAPHARCPRPLHWPRGAQRARSAADYAHNAPLARPSQDRRARVWPVVAPPPPRISNASSSAE